MTNPKTLLALLALLLLAAAPAAGLAPIQDEAAPAAAQEGETPAEEPALESTDQAIDVESSHTDAELAERLREIAEATGSFTDLGIDVRSGVAFLTGIANDEAHREWLSDVARRIEGVVAVSNQLSVREAPIWDLSPARKQLRSIARGFVRSLPNIGLAVVILLLASVVAHWVGVAVDRIARVRNASPLLATLLGRTGAAIALVIGLYIALETTGLTTVAATILGGTSIVGLALGFAFRDLAENFLAGVLLSVRRPFQIGDVIEIEGRTGVVNAVTSHGTRLMDFDGNVIQLANSTVYKGTIRNFTSNPKTRLSFTIGIGYDSSVEEAQSIILDFCAEQDAVLDDPEPIVVAHELGSSTVNLVVYAWTDSHRFSQLRVRSLLVRGCLKALDEAGISMPDDAREVVFPSPVPLQVSRVSREAAALAEQQREKEEEREEAVRARRTAKARPGEGSLESEAEELQQQARESDAIRDDESIVAPEGGEPAPARQ